MKFGISVKLSILLAAFGMLTSGLTGYYSYLSSRAMLMSASESDLLTATRVLGRNMQVSLDAIGKDARLLASLPRVEKISASPHGPSAKDDTHVVATVFKAMMSTHLEYFQIRLISAGMNGLEWVRVDRDGDTLMRVSGADLQEKSHYPYVFEALRLKRGEIYLSKITINHEIGAHAGLNKPTLRVATPVVADDGKVLGLIVINIELNGLFALLKADLPSIYKLYLTNERGDFLIHPDATQAFGFERGRRILVQESFAPVAAVIEGERESIVMNIDTAGAQQNRLVAAFARLSLGGAAANRSVLIGLSQPLDKVALEATRLAWYTLQGVLVFSALALVFAAVISRAITRPLRTMVQAVKNFSKERVISNLPLGRKDEIGLLAHSLRDMQLVIIEHLSELEEDRRLLDHIARHDSLTGLPNRALFYDRFRQALALAKRDNEMLALMLIDMDEFKSINDSLGHHAGDLLLQEVAHRMRDCVRESDTVARLGGDEFIVLLPLIEGRQDAMTVAEKIRHAINQPFDLEGQALITSVSIGISLYPEHGSDETQLSWRADSAMYHAKSGGCNRTCLYQS